MYQLLQADRDELASILKTSSNYFSWMKIVKLESNFTKICFRGSDWQSQHCSYNGLAPRRLLSNPLIDNLLTLIYITRLSPYCRIYASVNLVSIGSDNGLSPIRRKAIIYTSSELLSIGPFGINLSEILIKIQNFTFTEMHMKISFPKWRPFCAVGDGLAGANIVSAGSSLAGDGLVS